MKPDEIKALWQGLAFYNYVPVFVATGPRVGPSNAMFESGQEPFYKLLEDLNPDAIIVCGYRLWSWVTQRLSDEALLSDNQCKFGAALAFRIMHPSAIGFSSKTLYPIVQNFLNSARTLSPKSPAQ